MTQPGLITSILEDVGLLKAPNITAEHVRSTPTIKHVPASSILQPATDKSEPMQATWNYRSVIGKLNFLAANTRPDIAMAVHQCARFSSSPHLEHEKAVKHLCRYLLGTRHQGIILKPSGSATLDAFCDSDFAGTWTRDTSHLRSSALSRTGYVLTYANCPVLWVSKLQTEVALSTCEAEVMALSQCARELIPLRALLKDINTMFLIPNYKQGLFQDHQSMIQPRLTTSVINEDNQGCLELAMDTTGKHRPRTRHIGVKWWHFRDNIANGTLTVKKVATAINWADIFTKPLPAQRFQELRKLLMHW